MWEKIEQLIFYLLVFAIPVQARVILHEWTQPFNQWTSAYLYGTDILLAAIFLLWLMRSLKTVKISNFQCLLRSNLNRRGLTSTGIWLVIFFLVSAVSIFNSRIVGL